MDIREESKEESIDASKLAGEGDVLLEIIRYAPPARPESPVFKEMSVRTWASGMGLLALHLGIMVGMFKIGPLGWGWWGLVGVLWALVGLLAQGIANVAAGIKAEDNAHFAWMGFVFCLMALMTAPMVIASRKVSGGCGGEYLVAITHWGVAFMGMALLPSHRWDNSILAHLIVSAGAVVSGFGFAAWSDSAWWVWLGLGPLWAVILCVIWMGAARVHPQEKDDPKFDPGFYPLWFSAWAAALFLLQGLAVLGVRAVLPGWQVFVLMGLHAFIGFTGIWLYRYGWGGRMSKVSGVVIGLIWGGCVAAGGHLLLG